MWYSVQLLEPVKITKTFFRLDKTEKEQQLSQYEITFYACVPGIDIGRYRINGKIKINPYVEIQDAEKYFHHQGKLKVINNTACTEIPDELPAKNKEEQSFVYFFLPEEFKKLYTRVKRLESEVNTLFETACERWLEEKGNSSGIPVTLQEEQWNSSVHIYLSSESHKRLKEELLDYMLADYTDAMSNIARNILSAMPPKMYTESLEIFLEKLLGKNGISQAINEIRSGEEKIEHSRWNYESFKQTTATLSEVLTVFTKVRKEALEEELNFEPFK